MLWKEAYKKKIISREDWEQFGHSIREKGQTLVTINGSFDLMHAGHLHILYEASKQGDILIVALNSDESIRSYKSPDRPIIPLEYRLQMMAALSFIDAITSFEELTPLAFLEATKPHVHVNGAEYGKDCIEKDTVEKNGGKVHIVELVPGLSTSQIVKKIQSLCD
jgi:rfaE bifunctional protein nucleotidyltransferase chain/domain